MKHKNSEGVADESPRPAPITGFARTPEVLRYGGPQMEDYPDWDSWYLARQVWVLNRMKGESLRK